MNNPLLHAKDISMHFGGLKAVDGFNLHLNAGELIGLIGPNGAGKTTVFNVLTGIYRPTLGTLTFCDVDCLPLKPFQVARLGLTRTFQNIRLFRDLSVLDNVVIPMQRFASHSVLSTLLGLDSSERGEAKIREDARQLLEIFSLHDFAHKEAGSLPYGAQRKLEIARALATRPKVILLDEPAAGMNHRETEDLMGLIAKIRKQFDLTILLIEHDMKLVMGICERIVVLDHGVVICEGSPSQIKSDSKVIAAYLGTDNGN